MPLNCESATLLGNIVAPCSYTGDAACTSARRRACERKGAECKAFREFSNSKYGEFNPDRIGFDVRVPPCGACEIRHDGCERGCKRRNKFYGGYAGG